MEKAEYKKCTGEAHSNPYIDNCMICMPFWESYPICPMHKIKLTSAGFCKTCRKFYEMDKTDTDVAIEDKLFNGGAK